VIYKTKSSHLLIPHSSKMNKLMTDNPKTVLVLQIP